MTQKILDFQDYIKSPADFEHAFSWSGGEKIHETNFGKCLGYVLYGLKWRGEIWHLTEALPHFSENYDIVHFFNTMANLGYKTNSVNLTIGEIDSRLLPCVFVPKNSPEAPIVILKQRGNEFDVFDSSQDKLSTLKMDEFLEGDATFFTPILDEKIEQDPSSSSIDPDPMRWFRGVLSRMKIQIYQGFFLTFIITIFGVFSSIYIMNIYDRVVYIHSEETIKYLLSGILLIIAFDYILRNIRLRIFTWLGTRLASIMAPQIFGHIISLPAKYTESGTLSSQLARIRDSDAIRGFFSGSLILTMMEIPFVFIMLLAVYFMGGDLVIIPIFLLIFFVIIFFILLPMVRDSVEKSAQRGAQQYNITINTMNKIRFLQKTGNNKQWLEQLRLASGTATLANPVFLHSILESIGYGMYVVSGFATMWYGVVLVIDNKISSGALIGCMLLIWRLLGPLQTCLSSISVFVHLKRSIIQTHRLLLMSSEESKLKHSAVIPVVASSINLSNILLRHYNHPLIIFNGLNLTINAGELFMVTGRNGSGKTTFLKMLSGLYQPQSGSIRLKDVDIRQFDLSEYRRHIGYVPEKPDLFFGTIAQNLQIANPAASLESIVDTLKKLGCYENILSYDQGLNHHLEEFKSGEIPDTLKFQISLARAILRDPTMMLIDEAPHGYVNSPTNQHLIDYLQEWKGKKTVVMVAKSERLLKLADRVMFLLGDGRAVVGNPDEIIDFINKQSNFKFE